MYCDLCNKTISANEMVRIPLREMQQAVRDGFNPFKTPGIDMSASGTLASAFGISVEEVFQDWRQRVMADTTDWGLCPACAGALRRWQTPTGERDYSALLESTLESARSSAELAFKNFEKELASDPDTADKFFWLGAACMACAIAQEDPTYLDRAIDFFERALEIDPKHKNAYAKLLGAYMSKRDDDGVRRTAMRWAKVDPDLPEEARQWLGEQEATAAVPGSAEEPRAPEPAEPPGVETELPLWADVSRDPSLVDPLILERLEKSMCFMVRDETGPVAALIIRASPDEFRGPLTAEIPMSLYLHYYNAPTFNLYGVYPIVWDDPKQPFFKETWMVGADRVTGPPDPLSEGQLSRLEALLSQGYTYFLIVDRSNRLVAARRVNYSPATQEHFRGFLARVRAARSVTISNVELISALGEYMNRVSLEEVRAAARRLSVAEGEPKEEGIICANCKGTFRWDDAYNLQDTPGSYKYNPPGHGDFRPRAFCPHCGFLVAEWDIDRYTDRERWRWHGANAELNQDKPLPPGPLTWWGKPVPLHAQPITEEEFVDLSKVRALLREREDRRARKEKEVAPDDLEGYLERGFLHLEDNELDEAMADFQHCLELRADYAPAHRGLGWAYYLNRYSGDPKANMDKALSHLREAMRLDPKDGEPHFFLGIIHHNEGEEEEAIAEYRKALELGLPPEKEASARSDLGQKCIDRRQLGEAVAHFEKAKELDPSLFIPHTHLQIIYEAWGERAKAEVERREAERTCRGTSLVPSVEAKVRELASRGRPIPTVPLIRPEVEEERVYPWRGISKMYRVALVLAAIAWLCIAGRAMTVVIPNPILNLIMLFIVFGPAARGFFDALRPTTMRELVISPEKGLIFRRKSGEEKPVIAQIDRVAETMRGRAILIQGLSPEGRRVRAQIAKGNLEEGEFERFKECLQRLIPGVQIVPTRALPVRSIFVGITAFLGVLSLVAFLFTTGATIHDHVKGLESARIPFQTQLMIVGSLLVAFLLFAGLSVFLSERRKIGILFWSGLVVLGVISTGYILAYVWEGGLLREALPSVPITATPVPTPTIGSTPEATSTAGPTSPPIVVITYTVQPGDTLGKIAAEFGVTVEALAEANDIEDPSLINVGQVLVIPQP